jgi:opacity protein-like surface antigen
VNPNNPKLEAMVNKLEAQNGPALPASPDVQSPNNNGSAPVNNVESEAPINNSSASTAGSNNPPAMNSHPAMLDTKLHNSFYFNFSAATPTSPYDFTQSWGTGGSAGLGYGFALSKQTSIILSFQYSTFGFDLLDPGVSWTGGDFHTAMGLVNGKFILVNADNPVPLYIIVGIGGAEFTADTLTGTNISTGNTVTVPGLSETDFAFRFGFGVDIRLDKGLYLTVESNGVDTFVSQSVSDSQLVNSQFGVGMRFDN